MKIVKKIYNVCLVLLALLSIVIVILDLNSKISLQDQPYLIIDTIILIIFTVDYVARLALSKNKIKFFRSNIFDLLAILPFNSLFSFFRFTRIFRLAKAFRFTKFIRLVGFIGKLKAKLEVFQELD